MTHFPDALKTWRKARRFSQLDLALEADVSSRHISFLETGRAQPSREMVARLGDALNLPLETRNQLLTHAGYAVRYPGRSWDEEEMAPIRAALDHTLTQHAPYPAFAVDRLWTIVRMNEPAEKLFGLLGVSPGASLLELITSDAMPAVIENWPEVAHHSAQRLRTESAAQGGVEKLDEAASILAAVPGGGDDVRGPIIPTIYRAGDLRLSLFSTVAQFGTPVDLTLDDLKIELFFPADSITEQTLRAMG
ncbi:MAG: helix-turn-helix transcriptional regulator [Alphaproteobacteria bacterium]|nr:helix-turn-helix transcriptional regulator [Alphaproteobacteria bacterium]